ncbi:hypothetical protein EBZ80_26995, partial [bacterium]|nr:hypothetical protein [bacterium]
PLVFTNTGPATTSCTISPALPAGLTIAVSGGTCRITGTPTVASDSVSTYTVTALSANGAPDTASVSIKVVPIAWGGLLLWLDAANPASYPGTGTTWFDISGNSRNATLNGPQFSSTGQKSFVFDGNDFISLPHDAGISSNPAMTLEVFVKFNSSTNQIFAQKWNYSGGGGYGLEIYGGLLYGYSSAFGTYPTTPIANFSVGGLHQFAVTLSGSTQVLYANGSRLSTSAGGSITTSPSSDFRIGGRSVGGDGGSYLTGNVHAVRLYNRALPDAEILQNFNAGAAYLRLASPAFGVTSGSYTKVQNVTIIPPVGANVYYTTDGSTPSRSSTLYASPVSSISCLRWPTWPPRLSPPDPPSLR